MNNGGASEISVDELLQQKSGIRLDIGCGENKQAGFVGIDKRALDGVDIVHDVEVIPWPLPNECVIVAMCSHLVEHIKPWLFVDFINELWRVMKPGGEIAISCPHGSSQGFLQDPTHCAAFNEVTWAYFDPLEPNTGGQLWRIYKPLPWKIKYLSWSPAANIEVVLIKRRGDASYV